MSAETWTPPAYRVRGATYAGLVGLVVLLGVFPADRVALERLEPGELLEVDLHDGPAAVERLR